MMNQELNNLADVAGDAESTDTIEDSVVEIPACAVLRSDQIEEIVEHKKLIVKNFDAKQVSAASYDIRLGPEFYQHGKIQKLQDDEENKWVEVEPLDMVYVSSFEEIALPNNIIGRYSLRLGLMYKGLVLAGGGAQVDPGYCGKLFGLLINFSNKSILLEYKEHWATIEFSPTTYTPGKSRLYKDQPKNYQDCVSISHLFPTQKAVAIGDAKPVESALRKLLLNTQDMQKESQKALTEFKEQITRDIEDFKTRAQETLDQHKDFFTKQTAYLTERFEEQANEFEERYLGAYNVGVERLDKVYERGIDRLEKRVNLYTFALLGILGLVLAIIVISLFFK
jgi:deoxycytidine triphosphate deaminase